MTAMLSDRLIKLRGELSRQGLDGFVVPRADEHLGEYVPAGAERLAWLTGFTGSAGIAVVHQRGFILGLDRMANGIQRDVAAIDLI